MTSATLCRVPNWLKLVNSSTAAAVPCEGRCGARRRHAIARRTTGLGAGPGILQAPNAGGQDVTPAPFAWVIRREVQLRVRGALLPPPQIHGHTHARHVIALRTVATVLALSQFRRLYRIQPPCFERLKRCAFRESSLERYSMQKIDDVVRTSKLLKM